MLVPKNTKKMYLRIKELTVFNWKFRQRLSGFGKIPTDTEKKSQISLIPMKMWKYSSTIMGKFERERGEI